MNKGMMLDTSMLVALKILIVVILIFAALIYWDSITAVIRGKPSLPQEVNTPFPVNAWGVPYTNTVGVWTDCSQQDGGWQAVDEFCKCGGYSGALEPSQNPCFQKGVEERYHWADTCPATRGASTGDRGAALTKVRCKQ